ncbi:MazG nucleotide pyrophosphohydrolase domain-containing protein [Aliidiomarina taiwanensis]|nr:MazG nucleotide pyrophosphohydrolase domain-containing protein [Aliidiomarina taiwanensis]
MQQAVAIQQAASQHGFDWQSLAPVMDKIREEIDEVNEELTAEVVQRERVTDELGDLLFAVLNLVRHAQVDPDVALQSANEKFSRRFQKVTESVASGRGAFSDYSLDELELFWQQAKRKG